MTTYEIPLALMTDSALQRDLTALKVLRLSAPACQAKPLTTAIQAIEKVLREREADRVVFAEMFDRALRPITVRAERLTHSIISTM